MDESNGFPGVGAKKLDSHKGVMTAFGKIIPEVEAYRYCGRTIAAFAANLFAVMRILNPSWEDRTAALCENAYNVNLGTASTPAALKKFQAGFNDEWNFPEFLARNAWLGAQGGGYGDEYNNMAGRLIQFTENRVEKELDTCPWDIVGSEMCNMTTATFTANFDLASGALTGIPTNEVSLNMCEARGCGNPHCRVVAERRDHFNLPKQDWLDHRGSSQVPVHDTPPERRLRDNQGIRSGVYTSSFGEQFTFSWQYDWLSQLGWTWSVNFPILAIREMAEDDDEWERIFTIIFNIAGKNLFIEPSAVQAMRDWLGVPGSYDKKDARIMGAYIKNVMDCQLVPNEFEAFTKDEVVIRVSTDDFNGRFPIAPLEEMTLGYEAEWNGAVKTLVDAEFSVWIDDKDEDYMLINVGRKVDDRMM